MNKLNKIHTGNGCYEYTEDAIAQINATMNKHGLNTVTDAIEIIEGKVVEEMLPISTHLSRELAELTQKVRTAYDEAGGLAIALGNPGAVSALLIEKFPEERVEDLGAAAIFAGLESVLTSRDLEALSTPGALLSFS